MLQRSQLQTVTIKSTIGTLSSLFGWCLGRGMVDSNPFDGVARTVREVTRGTKEETDRRRRPFAEPELVTLLNSVPTASWLWTMTVLGLYTGMRVNELAECRIVDVHDTHIHIPEAKSRSGIRDVPIHPVIQPLVAYLTDTDSDEYLVSGMTRGGYDNKRHHHFSKQFSLHKKHTLHMPDTVVFHSLRANFVTALEVAGVPLSTIELIIGHARGALAYNTYSGGLGIQPLSEAVQQVAYGALVDSLVTDRIQTLNTQHSA